MGRRSAAQGGGNACESNRWGLRLSSSRGHAALPEVVGETHARATAGAFGGTPFGAAKRVK
eukprot:9427238-Pyramimonas_sp.AAC.1